MKICLVTNYWKESPGGGIKTYLSNLYDILSKKKIDIVVIFRMGLDKTNIHISGSKLKFILCTFIELIKIRPTVINSQEYWYCLLPCTLYRVIFGGRLIHTFRSEPDQSLSNAFLLFYQLLINQCDCVTFVSRGLKDIVEEKMRLNFGLTWITYPGVKNSEVTAGEVATFYEKFGIPKNAKLLLVQAFTANKTKAQGTMLVMDSMKLLNEKYPNLMLIITRDGVYTKELMKYAESIEIAEKVIFTGDLDDPFVPLVASDIFIFPWLGRSGVGNALLEAMICGKPIVATMSQKSGVSEIINSGYNGMLVSPNAQEMANIVELLLQKKDLCEYLGSNAKNDAMAKFSWDECANKFLHIYGNE